MNAQQVLEDRVAANADRALRQLLLHQIFEAQAEAQPGAVAVVFGDEAVTYGELEARANRFARYLRRRTERRIFADQDVRCRQRAGAAVRPAARRRVDACGNSRRDSRGRRGLSRQRRVSASTPSALLPMP